MDADAMWLSAVIRKASPAAFQEVPRDRVAPVWHPVYDFLATFIRDHRKTPRQETVEATLQCTLPPAPEEPSYYARDIRSNAMRVAMEDGLVNHVATPLRDSKPEEALEGAKRVIQDVQRSFAAPDAGLILPDQRLSVPVRWQDYWMRKAAGDRIGLPTPWQTLTRDTGGFQPGEGWIIAARPNVGKAQPLDARVWTPDGPREMGDLRVGDSICSIDGQPARVLAIHPQGCKTAYRATFSDGRSTETSGDHLWRVYYRSWPAPAELTTEQVLALLTRKRYRGRLWIDVVSGEGFGQDPSDGLPLDPWLLGFLLGNGCFCGTLQVAMSDPAVIERVRQALPRGLHLAKWGRGNYGMTSGQKGVPNPIIEALRALGLWGLEAHAKRVPPPYLDGSRATRLAVLTGLIDSDGEVTKGGSVRFSSSSEELAQNVVDLTRSLGGIARRRERATPRYPHRGELRAGRPAHVCRVALADLVLTHSQRAPRVRYTRVKRLTFASIVPTRATEMQCITTSHPSGLYVTDDFIVTHNSWLMLVIATVLWQTGYRVLFVSEETPPQSALPRDKNHRVVADRCVRCHTAAASTTQKCPAAEVPRQRLTVRLDAIAARVSAWRMLKGILTPLEEERLRHYYMIAQEPERWGWGQLRVVAAPAVKTLADVEAQCLEFEPDILLWDSAYLGIEVKGDSRKVEAAGDFAIDAHHMLQRLQVPGVLSWHLKREVDEDATDASLSDLALTDELARAFDNVTLLFRPPELERAGEAILRSAKTRDGLRSREIRIRFMVRDVIDFGELGDAAPGRVQEEVRR